MNLILRTHENVNDPVWSVIISILILLVGVSYYIVYIMRIAFDELNDLSDLTSKDAEQDKQIAVLENYFGSMREEES